MLVLVVHECQLHSVSMPLFCPERTSAQPLKANYASGVFHNRIPDKIEH